VFFFDEAHLLFEEAPKALVEKVEQVVRLIRSKGVGVYFISQNPLDIPGQVLGQLGNRIQHALRAFTPRDQRAVRAAAETFRANPKLDVSEAITQLGVGEALVSTLHDKGVPSIVERTLIRPPSSRIGPATAEERRSVMSRSPVAGRYDQAVDRDSAYEVLKRRAEQAAAEAAAAQEAERARAEEVRASASASRGGRQRQGPLEAMITSAARSIGSQIGRQILRGVLGSLTRR
jgi:DNA double-strand break repair helicase HerA and related ATPase